MLRMLLVEILLEQVYNVIGLDALLGVSHEHVHCGRELWELLHLLLLLCDNVWVCEINSFGPASLSMLHLFVSRADTLRVYLGKRDQDWCLRRT